MRRLVLGVLGILAVTGCASSQTADSPSAAPHHYSSLRESFYASVPPRMTPKMDRAGVPRPLQQQLFDCMWQTVSGSLTPDELTAIDTSMRTRTPVGDPAMRADIETRMGRFMKDDPRPELQSTCPNTIKQLAAYSF